MPMHYNILSNMQVNNNTTSKLNQIQPKQPTVIQQSFTNNPDNKSKHVHPIVNNTQQHTTFDNNGNNNGSDPSEDGQTGSDPSTYRQETQTQNQNQQNQIQQGDLGDGRGSRSLNYQSKQIGNLQYGKQGVQRSNCKAKEEYIEDRGIDLGNKNVRGKYSQDQSIRKSNNNNTKKNNNINISTPQIPQKISPSPKKKPQIVHISVQLSNSLPKHPPQNQKTKQQKSIFNTNNIQQNSYTMSMKSSLRSNMQNIMNANSIVSLQSSNSSSNKVVIQPRRKSPDITHNKQNQKKLSAVYLPTSLSHNNSSSIKQNYQHTQHKPNRSKLSKKSKFAEKQSVNDSQLYDGRKSVSQQKYSKQNKYSSKQNGSSFLCCLKPKNKPYFYRSITFLLIYQIMIVYLVLLSMVYQNYLILLFSLLLIFPTYFGYKCINSRLKGTFAHLLCLEQDYQNTNNFNKQSDKLIYNEKLGGSRKIFNNFYQSIEEQNTQDNHSFSSMHNYKKKQKQRSIQEKSLQFNPRQEQMSMTSSAVTQLKGSRVSKSDLLTKKDSLIFQINSNLQIKQNFNKPLLIVPYLHNNQIQNMQKCHYCPTSYTNTRTKHCNRCDMCHFNYDHYCKWLSVCVDGVNYRYFINFLLSVEIIGIGLILGGLWVIYLVLKQLKTGMDVSDRKTAMLWGWCLVYIQTIFSLIFSSYVLIYHIWLNYRGVSTRQHFSINPHDKSRKDKLSNIHTNNNTMYKNLSHEISQQSLSLYVRNLSISKQQQWEQIQKQSRQMQENKKLVTKTTIIENQEQEKQEQLEYEYEEEDGQYRSEGKVESKIIKQMIPSRKQNQKQQENQYSDDGSQTKSKQMNRDPQWDEQQDIQTKTDGQVEIQPQCGQGSQYIEYDKLRHSAVQIDDDDNERYTMQQQMGTNIDINDSNLQLLSTDINNTHDSIYKRQHRPARQIQKKLKINNKQQLKQKARQYISNDKDKHKDGGVLMGNQMEEMDVIQLTYAKHSKHSGANSAKIHNLFENGVNRDQAEQWEHIDRQQKCLNKQQQLGNNSKYIDDNIKEDKQMEEYDAGSPVKLSTREIKQVGSQPNHSQKYEHEANMKERTQN